MQSTETSKTSDIALTALGAAERLAIEGFNGVETRLHASESSSPFEQQLSKQTRSERELSNLLHGYAADAQ